MQYHMLHHSQKQALRPVPQKINSQKQALRPVPQINSLVEQAGEPVHKDYIILGTLKNSPSRSGAPSKILSLLAKGCKSSDRST